MKDQQILFGGREGKILREEEYVVRPGNPWTAHVHAFLRFLHEKGFTCVPRPEGVRPDGREVLSFVPGTVHNDGLPDEIMTDEVLVQVAQLMKRYHTLGEEYVQQLSGDECWMLPSRVPAEVMCHGDFAPYNMTFVDGAVHGVIDFDTLHPGPRLWDIAYAVYRWIPFVAPTNPDYRCALPEQLRRLALFAEAYGLSPADRRLLPAMMVQRLQALADYMRAQADGGNEDVQRNIEDGHLALYLTDIAYMEKHAGEMIQWMENPAEVW